MSRLVAARRLAPPAGRAGRARDDAVTLASSLVLVAGLFADGVVHNRAESDLESFLTVPHAIIFLGFVLAAVWILTVLDHHRRASGAAAAWPPGYRLSVVGLVAFAVGLVGDSVWHSPFGIEADVEALLSPTHLAMSVGGVLLLTTPARRAWALLPTGPRLGWGEAAGLLGSVTLATMVVAFFTQFAWALSATVPARPLVPRAGVADVLLLEQLERADGIAAILLTTLVLLLPAVALQRRWVMPVGATALVTTTAAGVAMFRSVTIPWPPCWPPQPPAWCSTWPAGCRGRGGREWPPPPGRACCGQPTMASWPPPRACAGRSSCGPAAR